MKMEEFLRSKSRLLKASLVCCFHLLNLNSCFSLNYEGVALLRLRNRVTSDPHGALSNWIDGNGVETPCCWLGVECSEGHVVALNLKDLNLKGTLAPEIGSLVHAKYINLRNNSFFGAIPKEIASLRRIRVLDLRHNNFSGQVHVWLDKYFSAAVLLLDNNELLRTITASSSRELVISRNSEKTGDVASRKLSQDPPFEERGNLFWFFPPTNPESTLSPPPPAPSPSPWTPAMKPSPSPSPSTSPSPVSSISPSLPSPAAAAPSTRAASSSRHHSSRRILIVSAAAGGPLLLLLVIGIYFWRSGKVSTVKPWATGLSGQLQRAFITGVPRLKRSELEAACEDFSNVIGSASLCTLYKGTLSSGVEIAVASVAVGSSKQWSSSMEAQFRKKIDTLSKVNHKNFASLLGYCVEEKPFTRMMVFEYAPNGTLFEHLHIKEAEHLDWPTRLRIAMGIAYCLDHMHQMSPPFIHRNLKSSAVYLTEDYAAKVSDFGFSDERASASEGGPDAQGNVYSFGVVLYEMITGKLPYMAGTDPPQNWASDYLSGMQCLQEKVDPTLEAYGEDQLRRIGGVVGSCTDPDPRRRPAMREICQQLRGITGIEPEVAVPKLSPLWWAELEILSTDAD